MYKIRITFNPNFHFLFTGLQQRFLYTVTNVKLLPVHIKEVRKRVPKVEESVKQGVNKSKTKGVKTKGTKISEVLSSNNNAPAKGNFSIG